MKEQIKAPKKKIQVSDEVIRDTYQMQTSKHW